MNSPILLVASILLSAATATGVILLAGPEAPALSPEQISQKARLAAVEQAFERVRGELEALREERAGEQAPRAAVPDLSPDRIAEAVARYLDQRGAADAAADRDPLPPYNVAAAVETLRTLDNLWEGEADKVWALAAEQGRLEQLAESLLQFAKDNPNDAAAQVLAGTALIQRIQRETLDQMEVGTLAMKADHAFDEALDIDENHWSARFTKAMSYTFWPDVFGKKAAAIGHFETLIQQQERGAPQPQFAQTYLLLGNLYEQQGNADKAKALWVQGAALFPGDPALQQKLQ